MEHRGHEMGKNFYEEVKNLTNAQRENYGIFEYSKLFP